MNRGIMIILLAVFLFIAAAVTLDILEVHSDIAYNRDILDNLKKEQAAGETQIRDLELKINKLKTDPKTAEQLVMTKFKMLRKDQYIINDSGR